MSILTFIFAYKIYRNFDVKKAHINKQLDTVLSLIEQINKTLIIVNFRTKIPDFVLKTLPQTKYNTTLESWHYSLFIIGSLNKEKFESWDIFLSANVKDIMPFLNFIYNPLLPKSIAEKLNNFYSPFINYKTFETASTKYVELLPSEPKGERIEFQFPDFTETYKSFNNLIQSAKELRNEIEKWLKRYGSKDINFNLYLQNPHF